MSAINCVTTVEPYCGHAVDSAAMHFAIELYACNKI